jgi:hypothetical protein
VALRGFAWLTPIFYMFPKLFQHIELNTALFFEINEAATAAVM